FKRDASRRVEPGGCVEKAFGAISDEIIEFAMMAEHSRSERASDRADQMKVSGNTLVTRVVRGLLRNEGLHEAVLATSVPRVAASVSDTPFQRWLVHGRQPLVDRSRKKPALAWSFF